MKQRNTFISTLILYTWFIFPNMISFLEVKDYYPLSTPFLAMLQQKFHAQNFIETGTFMGQTTINAASIFSAVYTIELSESLYNKNLNKFRPYKNIHAHRGDSSHVLQKILPRIAQKPTIIFLDAHFSGGVTAKGKEDTPLKTELELIKRHTTSSVIIIDDLRYCQSNQAIINKQNSIRKIYDGYPSISDIKAMLHDINPTYELVIYGDTALAFPQDIYPNITVSNIVHAMTHSRFFDETNEHSLQEIEDLIRSERCIMNASTNEAAALKELTNPKKKLNGPRLFTMHYSLWHGLVSLGEKNYDKAEQLFNDIVSDFPHWRIQLYLAYCLEKKGDLPKSKQLRAHISKFCSEVERIYQSLS